MCSSEWLELAHTSQSSRRSQVHASENSSLLSCVMAQRRGSWGKFIKSGIITNKAALQQALNRESEYHLMNEHKQHFIYDFMS